MFDKMRNLMALIDDLYMASTDEDHKLASDLYLEVYDMYQDILKQMIERGDFSRDHTTTRRTCTDTDTDDRYITTMRGDFKHE